MRVELEGQEPRAGVVGAALLSAAGLRPPTAGAPQAAWAASSPGSQDRTWERALTDSLGRL